MDERDDERRMTRVETILEAHEQILLRIEAKMDERFMSRDETMAEINGLQRQINDSKYSLQRQITEIKRGRSTFFQTWPHWITAAIALGALIISVWPKG